QPSGRSGKLPGCIVLYSLIPALHPVRVVFGTFSKVYWKKSQQQSWPSKQVSHMDEVKEKHSRRFCNVYESNQNFFDVTLGYEICQRLVS
ncbi:MAG: hypothetical protein ACJAUL_002741, partial [Paraglaciecola sp.]